MSGDTNALKERQPHRCTTGRQSIRLDQQRGGRCFCSRCGGGDQTAHLMHMDRDERYLWLLDHGWIAYEVDSQTVTDRRSGRTLTVYNAGRSPGNPAVALHLGRHSITLALRRMEALRRWGVQAVRGHDVLVDPATGDLCLAPTRTVERCAACGTLDGPRKPSGSPARFKGERFGFPDAMLCQRCYQALHRRGRRALNRRERGYTGGHTGLG